MLGTVLYLRDIETGSVNFLSARNLIVSKQLKKKSIPCLELHAISHGVKHLVNTWKDLCGKRSLVPLNIVKLRLYSDSMVALSWVNGNAIKLEKQQNLTPFVTNRLKIITDLCEEKPIDFSFIAGEDNPSDMILGR